MSEYILEMKDITKTFGPVRALDTVNLKVKKGHIHALVGENGAGKSTLMNVLSGVYAHGSYTGDIIYEGDVCKFSKIHDSENKGIIIIHQELALIPEMSIGENMFLGNEKGKKMAIDWDNTYSEADKYLKTVGLKEPSRTKVSELGVGKQQLVEIAKALAKNAKLLILDEPTSSLNEADSLALLELLLQFKEEGMTSIIISHKLNEVSYVADEITVIRDGQSIETIEKGNTSIDENRIIKGMVGRELSDRFPKRLENYVTDEVALKVDNWSVIHPIYRDRKVVDDVSFNIKKGEVVGFSGLQGAGRTELVMSLFGKSYGQYAGGKMSILGNEVSPKNEKEAIKMGLAYVTEDRKGNGLILSNPIRINTTLANLTGVSKNSVIDIDMEHKVSKEYVEKMHTKCSGVEQNVGNLSGGNQQKVLLSKWMFSNPEVLILDEPTRGIDVGAKYEIYCIINDLVSMGKSVIIISSEMPEVLGMSDRIYVMNEGKIVGEFKTEDATQEKIMASILKSGA